MRLLLGVGEAAMTPAGMRWIRFHVPEQKRGMAVGIFFAAAKVGPAVAPYLATWLMVSYGWQQMFIVMGIGCMAWLIPWVLLVPDDDRRIEAAQRQASGTPPVSFGAVLRSPVMWGTFIGTFAYQYLLYFCMTWLPAYLVERRGLSLKSMALFSGFTFAGMAIVAILGGMWADRMIKRGRDPVRVRKGFAIAGLLLGSTEVFGAFAHSREVALFFVIFSLSGLGLMTANYWALTQTLIPGGAVGRIVGLQNCVAQFPGMVGPVITGWLIQKTGNYQAPMGLMGVLLLMGVAAYIFLVRREYAPRPRPSG
jgi:MFS family permease